MSSITQNPIDHNLLRSQNTRFGIMITALCCSSAAYFHYVKFQWAQYSPLLLAFGLITGIITFFTPKLLTPLTKSWFSLGNLMGKIVSPIVLGAIFYLLITPIGLLGHLFDRDELRLKKTVGISYWIRREPQTQRIDPFKNQL